MLKISGRHVAINIQRVIVDVYWVRTTKALNVQFIKFEEKWLNLRNQESIYKMYVQIMNKKYMD